MKTKTKSDKVLAVVAAFMVAILPTLLPPAASAQDNYSSFNLLQQAMVSSGALGADDSDVALLIKYIGPNAAGGTVTVAAGGDITLSEGAVGSSAVDSSVECDASIAATGSRSGIFDVSIAACDTLGEVVDLINSQVDSNGVHHWVAVILDGLRSDSSNDTLVALSETAANSIDGLQVKWDTSVALTSTIALTPERTLGAFIEPPTGVGSRAGSFVANPYLGRRTVLFIANATSTYASGTSTYTIYSVKVNNTNAASGGTETVTTLYSTAAGATTVNQVFDFTPYGLYGKKGEKMIVRLTNSAAMASTTHYAYGLSFRYN